MTNSRLQTTGLMARRTVGQLPQGNMSSFMMSPQQSSRTRIKSHAKSRSSAKNFSPKRRTYEQQQTTHTIFKNNPVLNKV